MKVIISRNWNRPAIEATVTDDSITLQCPLEDFIKGMVAECGPAWKILTAKQLEAQMLAAAEAARLKIQEVSSQAII